MIVLRQPILLTKKVSSGTFRRIRHELFSDARHHSAGGPVRSYWCGAAEVCVQKPTQAYCVPHLKDLKYIVQLSGARLERAPHSVVVVINTHYLRVTNSYLCYGASS